MKKFKIQEFGSAPNQSEPPQVKFSTKRNSAEKYFGFAEILAVDRGFLIF